MTLWIARQYTKLSVRQRIVLLTTLILPSLVIQTLLVHFAPVPLFLVVIVNLVWCMTTATIVASTMNEDTSRMERLVDQNAAQLSDEVIQLREDLRSPEVIFTAPRTTAKYCSSSCRQAAYRARSAGPKAKTKA